MAKGNFFLGTARGSVGDVTFYQNRGQQVARVRKRAIANPKSAGQILSRAITATVSKAYSAGRAIFDHSFEGRKQGQECQDRFGKLNTNLLRSVYADDIEASRAPLNALGRFASRGASGCVPWSFIVSEGSLGQDWIQVAPPGDYQTNNASRYVFVTPAGSEATADETVGDYMRRCGLSVGDIFTLVSIGYDDMGQWSTVSSYPALFGFVRCTINPTAVIQAQKVSETSWPEFMLMEFNGPFFNDSEDQFFNENMSVIDNVDLSALGLPHIGAFGVIRSRDDSGARSYCRLKCTYDWQGMDAEDYNWGISSPALVDSWQGTQFEYNSELILEGGDIQAQLDKEAR